MKRPSFLVVLAAAMFLPHAAFSQDWPDNARAPRKIGFLTAALSYHATYGPRASVGLLLDNEQGRLGLSVDKYNNAIAYGIDWRSSSDRSPNPQFGLALGASATLADEVFGFDQTEQFIRPSLSWDLPKGQQVTSYLTLSGGKIMNVAEAASPLIQIDTGDFVSRGAGLSYWVEHENADRAGAQSLEVSVEYSQTSRAHSYVEANAVANKTMTVVEGVPLSARLSIGHIVSLEGASAINQRYFLGPAALRGFALGGVGPRDVSVSEKTALGGNSFAALQLDLKFDRASMMNGQLVPGVFADLGSVWSLDDNNNSPAVDDGFTLRSAVGLSLDINTGVGPIRISYAHPVRYGDYDLRQSLSLSFQARF